IPRQLVAGHRSRGDREPHGGHRDRRDLPRTVVAMGAAPLRAARRPRDRSRALPHHPAAGVGGPRRGGPAARSRRAARRPGPGFRVRRVPHPAGLPAAGCRAREPELIMRPDLQQEADALARRWTHDARWRGIRRDYQPGDVVRLRPSVMVEHTLARRGAERLWALLQREPYVKTFGALTGTQAVQMVKAGLEAIYLSGWQVAADAVDVPTLIVARTDALSATLLTSDIDPRDREFCTGERTAEGYFRVRDGLETVLVRALAYAPYADLLWFETAKPDLEQAR